MATFEQYLKKKGVSQTSMKFYVSDIRVFSRWVETVKGSKQITKEAFESYEHFLKNNGLPIRSVNRKLSSLRKYSEYLVSEKKLRSFSSIKNKPKNKSEIFVNTKRLTNWLNSISPSYSLLILFGVILLLGAVIISDRQNPTDSNLVPQSGKLTLPVVINLSGNSDNLSKLVNSDSSYISLDSDPIIRDQLKLEEAGKAVIDQNESETKIFVPGVTNSSIILLTTAGSKSNVYIKEQDDGYFIVGRDSPLTGVLKFNWLVISNRLPLDINR